MTTNEFGGTLFRNSREMLDAIAAEWLSAGGANSEAYQAEVLAAHSDAELAREAIDGWGLDMADQWDDRPSHMEFHGYTAGDLADAFARHRAMGE